ncbi:hypothetical protein HDU77_006312 [Chytriomyces hyalinus]|nr:hypothetical protein HDU77_006312 [Chytriomyces hyalinus]
MHRDQVSLLHKHNNEPVDTSAHWIPVHKQHSSTNDTEYMTCLQELGQLDSKSLLSDFMDDSHGLQVIQASGKIAENISTSMEVLTKSYIAFRKRGKDS